MVAITFDLPRAKRPSLIPRMRPILTLSLAVVAAASLRAEAPPLDGTMPEDLIPALRPLLKEAVERSPTTIASSISIAQAQAGEYLNSAARYPNASASVYYQDERQSLSGGTSTPQKGFYYNAQVSQPLFEWYALKNQSMIGKLAEKVMERNFDEAYRLLAVSIREQYLGLIQKKILVRNDQFSLKIAQESQAAEQARFDAGSSSSAEMQQFKMVSEQKQLDADRALEDYGYTKQVFIRLVGIETLDENSIPLEVPHPQYNASKADAVLTGFVGGGVESTFQSQVFELEAHESELNYKIAKVRLIPKFQAVGTFSYQIYSAPSATSVAQVGIETESGRIEADWQIFDGFATKGQKLSALANKRYYERARQTYVDNAVDQISYLRHQLGFSARAMSIAEVQNALIGAEVKRVNQDLALGYASQSQIDSGTLNLYSTEYQQANARADFFSHWTEFVSLAGVDPALANLSEHHAR